MSRFRVDDLTPYIYRTRDSGKTWQLITTGLPNDAPIDTVREDPVRKGLAVRRQRNQRVDVIRRWRPLAVARN